MVLNTDVLMEVSGLCCDPVASSVSVIIFSAVTVTF